MGAGREQTVDDVVVERGIAGLAPTACVRILGVDGSVVGSGFLVGPNLVATCAHVVADALVADPFASEPPSESVSVDFPMLVDRPASRSARVRRWVPIGEDGTGDIALLELASPAPPDAVMPPVRRVDGLWDHGFRVFGFPEGRSDGVWSTGLIRAGQATGWFQLQGAIGDQPIEGGFSGSPVWDDQSDAVVGMTVAADRDPSVTTAYLIPIEHVLGLDPELLPNPYRGLSAFDEEHADYFFGRDAETRRLRDAVRRCPMVAVAGPSGSGKSSLVRAGLVPVLRADGVPTEEVRCRSDAPVLPEIAAVLLAMADPDANLIRRARDARRLGDALAEPERRGAAAEELVAAVSEAEAEYLVLRVDQFEELAETAPAEARELLEALAALSGGRLRVVLTVRGLALDEVLTPSVAEALGSGTVLVGPMDRAQLREAVVRPAERAPGLAFEPGLVDRILDDCGSEPAQLPLLESLLAQLWVRREGGLLTNLGYDRAGGVAGALTAHVERVVGDAFGTAEQLEALRMLGGRLVTPGRDGAFVRRPVPYAELPSRLRELVPPLVAGRVLVVAGGQGSAATVELAHQSLVEQWPRLREWLRADQEFLSWRAGLDADQQRWAATDRDHEALLRGTALLTAEGWAERQGTELTDAEQDYLAASRARRRRDRRRTRAVIAAVVALALIAGVVTIVAVRGRDRIATQQATADAERLGAEALARAAADPLAAARLALAAWDSEPRNTAARAALANQYLALASVNAVLTGSSDGAPILAVRTAGAALMFTSGTGMDVLLDPSGTPSRRRLPDPSGLGADGGAFSADGRYYLYHAGDGAVRLWEIASDAAPAELVAADVGPSVKLAGFSPDGARFGWWRDGTVTLVDAATRDSRSAPLPLPAGDARLRLIDDAVVVTTGAPGSSDARSAVHALTGQAPPKALPAGTQLVDRGGSVGGLSCIPRDRAIPNSRSTLEVTDLATGQPIRRIPLSPAKACDYRVTLDGRYALELPLTLERGARWPWRVIELSSGRAHHVTTPPLAPESVDQTIAVLPSADGPPAVFFAAGPTVLRAATTPETPAETDSLTVRRFLLGRTLVGTDNTGRVASYEPATGRPLADLPGALSGQGIVFPDDDLWAAVGDGTGWEARRYPVPQLAPSVRIPLPAGAGGPPGLSGVTLVLNRLPGQPAQTMLALVGGQLSAWDPATGNALGHPIDLAANAPSARDWYRTHGGLWARVGHPGQALVATPDNRLQLWDVPAGRMLRELPIAVTGTGAVAAQGDRLAALVVSGGLQTWNLATGEQVETKLPDHGADALHGFDADGYLLGAHTPDQDGAYLVLYDLDRPGEAVTWHTAALGEIHPRPDSVTISGEAGRLPRALAVTAAGWRDHLCGLLRTDNDPPRPCS